VTNPIGAPIVGGMITSTIRVLILVPVFFALMKERALKHGALKGAHEQRGSTPRALKLSDRVRLGLKCAPRTVAEDLGQWGDTRMEIPPG
jgi:hypothetical protein